MILYAIIRVRDNNVGEAITEDFLAPYSIWDDFEEAKVELSRLENTYPELCFNIVRFGYNEAVDI